MLKKSNPLPPPTLFQVAQLSQEISWTHIFLEPQKPLPWKTEDLECNIKGFPNYVQRNENVVKHFLSDNFQILIIS